MSKNALNSFILHFEEKHFILYTSKDRNLKIDILGLRQCAVKLVSSFIIEQVIPPVSKRIAV